MPVSDPLALVAHHGKRWLYLIHRWVGIVTCLLLTMWFLSGLVMIYVPFPTLTSAEWLRGAQDVDWSAVHSSPKELLGGGTPPVLVAMALEQGATGPVWRVGRKGGAPSTLSAATGKAVPGTNATMAGHIAAAFGKAGVRSVEAVERDQWTVAGRFDPYRPLWKVSLNSADGRILYVASTTGEVVQDTTSRERFWNWLGSVPHWIYPTVLRKDQPLWRQVILWVSGAGIIGAISGMWIGILRIRMRRRYRGARMTPYSGWQWWHHVLGVAGGGFLIAWIISGWLSVDPNRWFATPGLSDAARLSYAGATAWPAIDWRRLGTLPVAAGARRMHLQQIDGQPLLVLERPDAPIMVINAATLAPVTLNAGRLKAAASRLLPGSRIITAHVLRTTDNYWYDSNGPVELPVLRVIFDDPGATWVHISLRTGAILSEMTRRQRLYRWLFDGLHKWDLHGLVGRRPLWDVWMWLWSIAGTIISASGIIIGVRRLWRTRLIRHG